MTFGCQVDTLTLSKEQKVLAEARAKEAGVSDRVRVHLLDYRCLPGEWKGQFDAFVAIEMLEHVVSVSVLLNRSFSSVLFCSSEQMRTEDGKRRSTADTDFNAFTLMFIVLTLWPVFGDQGAKWHPTFFSIIDWALKPTACAAAVCVTTQPESRYTQYQWVSFNSYRSLNNLIVHTPLACVRYTDFGRKYIWPGTVLPAVPAVVAAASKGHGGRMSLESVEDVSLIDSLPPVKSYAGLADRWFAWFQFFRYHVGWHSKHRVGPIP